MGFLTLLIVFNVALLGGIAVNAIFRPNSAPLPLLSQFSIRSARMICPSCLNELNQGPQATKIDSLYEMGSLDVSLKCTQCATQSIWSFLSQPPRVQSFRRPTELGFTHFDRRSPSTRRPRHKKIA